MNEQKKQEMKRYLSVVKRAISFIEDIIENEDEGTLETMLAQEPILQPPKLQTRQQDTPIIETTVNQPSMERSGHIGRLLDIDCWPESVPAILANKKPNEKEKNKRANMVMDMVTDRSVEGLDFLDYGCGEGHIAQQAILRNAKSSTGYDIEANKEWVNFPQVEFTTNPSSLNQYDMIIVYDVLDHSQDPEGDMNRIRNMIKDNGVVYVRCHPWTSLHGMHLHTISPELNKAFFHLFLTFDEIFSISNEPPQYTRTEKNPIEAYHWWFKDFEIKKERKIEVPIPDFFQEESFKKLLSEEQNIPMNEIHNFLEIMKIQFVDFCLIPK